MEVVLSDRMANRCVRGGAPLRVTTARCDARDETRDVRTLCDDLGDGRYRLSWQGQTAGSYTVSLRGSHRAGRAPAIVARPHREALDLT